jgi:hypothetical protein
MLSAFADNDFCILILPKAMPGFLLSILLQIHHTNLTLNI